MQTMIGHRLLCLLAGAAAIAVTATDARAETNTKAAEASEVAPSSLSGSYLAGRFAGKLRDMSNAAGYYSKALDDDPNNPVLIERTFVLELSAGNIDRAEELAQQVVGFNEQHRMSRFVLGLRDFRRGEYDKARANFKRAAFTPVGELSSAMLMAWSFAAENRLQEALDALDGLGRNRSFETFKTFHSALIAELLKDDVKAEQLYKTAYDQTGTSAPRLVEAYGRFLQRTGKKEEARKLYEEFTAASPGNPLIREDFKGLDAGRTPEPLIGSASDGVAETLLSLADALTDDQSIDVALVYAQLALASKKDFAVGERLLGRIYEDIKRNELAINAYEKIPLDSPLRPDADIQIASNYDQLGKRQEATAKLADLVKRDPQNFDAVIALGNLQRSYEQWKDAAETYGKAVALVKEPERKHWSLFYFRGISHERNGDWVAAEADFKKALALQPEQPAVLNYLGYTWIEKRMNLTEALEMVRKAVELRPSDGYIVDSLGWAHYQLGDYEEAVKHLERAVELRPEDPVINEHLGDAYWRVDRKLEARFQWQHAKDNKPEPKDLEKIERKLKEGLEAPKAPTPAADGTDPNKS